jgi:hypothetical protein
MAKGDSFVKKVLDAVCLLGLQDLKKRLIAGIAMKLIGSTV